MNFRQVYHLCLLFFIYFNTVESASFVSSDSCIPMLFEYEGSNILLHNETLPTISEVSSLTLGVTESFLKIRNTISQIFVPMTLSELFEFFCPTDTLPLKLFCALQFISIGLIIIADRIVKILGDFDLKI